MIDRSRNMGHQSRDNITAAQAIYDVRAPSYDASNGGWHVDLGRDFIEWGQPSRRARILDLACGTGLVTYPAAEAVGPRGLVIGVDISTGMLQQAKQKHAMSESGTIEWIEHDISNLDDVDAVQRIRQEDGFDLVTCCSALVLLAHPAEAIKQWAKLLKPGGKMIIDVPTEDKTVQHLWFNDLRQAVGIGLPFEPGWIKDIHSLEELYTQAGLGVEKSWRTPSYLPDIWHNKYDATDVLEEQIQKDKVFAENAVLQQKAKEVWPEIWKRGLRDDGRLWNGHSLYVAIGVKPLYK